MISKNTKPDFYAFHKSVTEELFSIKNRIESLVKNHWLTIGEDKETALRSLLRRYLPESVIAGRGFVVTNNECSSQIDILIVDASKPTVFKDGDFLLASPDSVLGVIEVKKTLNSNKKKIEAIQKLIKIEKICNKIKSDEDAIWSGLFVFESDKKIKNKFLTALGHTIKDKTEHINCIASSKDTLVTYDRYYAGFGTLGHYFKDYEITGMAPSGFINSLMEFIANKWRKSNFAWAPIPEKCATYTSLILPKGENIVRILKDEDQEI